jgi:hypothetical protein
MMQDVLRYGTAMTDDSRMLPGLDPDVLERVVSVEVETENVKGMEHRARVHGFTFHSDEPPEMAGENKHPYPLDYLTAAIGL